MAAHTPQAGPRPSDDLPFVSDKNFWNVTPTGDYQEDCRMGVRYARLLVHFMREHCYDDAIPILGLITLDMPAGEAHKGLKAGFFEGLARHLLEPCPDVDEISVAVERGKAVADMLSAVLEEDGVVVPEVLDLTPAGVAHTVVHEFEAIEKTIEKGMEERREWKVLAAHTKEVRQVSEEVDHG